jgi:hypothetical protein
MAGGLMQLVAYGQQDMYLTGRPQISFWKVTYRRYTNFAVESIEQTFNGQADFGRRVTCVVARNGDLAYRTYLQVTLPEINQNLENQPNQGVYARWLDYIGEHMVSQVEVEVGGQRIDRQYGDWMHIWNQLTGTSEHYERGYAAMVGNTTQLTYVIEPEFEPVGGPCSTDTVPNQVCAPRNALPETTLYVPLTFWFCRNPGLALPLIALQYHEVRINVDLRPIDECLWAMDSIGATNARKVTRAYSQSLVAASLYVDYVFLDADERRKMAQNPHEYLIEQLQFTGDESIGSSSNKIKLNFNHPCKQLVWVVQPDDNVDYCKSLEGGQTLYNLLGAQPFNYTDALDVLPNSIRAYGPPGLVGQGEFVTGNQFEQAGAGTTETGAVPLPSRVIEIALTQVVNSLGPAVGAATTYNTINGVPVTNANNFTAAIKFLLKFSAFDEAQTNAVYNPAAFSISNSDFLVGVGATTGINNAQGFDTFLANLFAAVDTTTATARTAEFGPTVATADAIILNSATVLGINAANLANLPSTGLTATVSDAGTFVLAETGLNLHCWGQNPVVTAKLQLNGQDRFSEREGTYFDLVQPYQHHTRTPDTGINVYSFALRPEEHQPCGTCNFSRIDNATLQLIVSNATVTGTNTAKVRVYATNYNVLRVMSGMGGLAYSN